LSAAIPAVLSAESRVISISSRDEGSDDAFASDSAISEDQRAAAAIFLWRIRSRFNPVTV